MLRVSLSAERSSATCLIRGSSAGEIGWAKILFCAQKRSQYANIPVIILSGSSSVHEKVIGFELGIEDYILKPFDITDVRVRVEARLRKTQKHRVERSKLNSEKIQLDLLAHRVQNILVLAETPRAD